MSVFVFGNPGPYPATVASVADAAAAAATSESVDGLPLLVVPVTSAVPKQVLTVRLGDRSYQLRLRWKPRASAWYLDVSTVGGERILSGQRLVISHAIGRAYRDDRLPVGLLFAFDTVQADREPTRDSLGGATVVGFYAGV